MEKAAVSLTWCLFAWLKATRNSCINTWTMPWRRQWQQVTVDDIVRDFKQMTYWNIVRAWKKRETILQCYTLLHNGHDTERFKSRNSQKTTATTFSAACIQGFVSVLWIIIGSTYDQNNLEAYGDMAGILLRACRNCHPPVVRAGRVEKEQSQACRLQSSSQASRALLRMLHSMLFMESHYNCIWSHSATQRLWTLSLLLLNPLFGKLRPDARVEASR